VQKTMTKKFKYPLKTSKLRGPTKEINVERYFKHVEKVRKLLLKDDPHRLDDILKNIHNL
jgi:hypothetical protein